ncbi:hypothetical protein [[Mycoplasma] anseris]|uniref:Phosphomevalonate kinase n=1 Tax=[Mycoplasma] anseris TaxID=92400 RepID=A0A2Z4NE76_9BACT|nr:hypothetical protein [[Mycoplasma] anseris]AWX69655.1 hypothetical protein DP065_02790 [[Mycoplasma] anseris]
MKIILICGKKQTGKTFLSTALAKQIQKNDMIVKTFAIADVLKNSIPNYDENLKHLFRPQLVKMGAEIRKKDPNQLIRKIADQIKQEQPDYVIINDVRLQNEINYFKNEFPNSIFVLKIINDMDNLNINDHDITEVDLDQYEPDLLIKKSQIFVVRNYQYVENPEFINTLRLIQNHF